MESVLVGFTLNKVYDQLRTALGDEYTRIRKAPNELEKLKRLKNVIFNVQEDTVDQDFNDWLNEMKDAAFDAEDIIDMFNTEILRRRSSESSTNHRTTRFICRVNDFFSCTTNPLIFRRKIGSSVQKTLCRLADIGKEREYHLTLSRNDGGEINQEIKKVPDISNLSRDVILGRDRDLQNVIERLIHPEKDQEMVVLAGMGGVGKTTLAKLVYHNSQVNDLFADRKIWICVSTKNFDLLKIVKDVIKQLQIKQKQKKIKGELCQIDNSEEMNLEALNLILIEIFRENEKFLLVLDDVWSGGDFNSKWGKMESFFHQCKIMVTTREKNIKSAMSKFYLHHVGCLPENVCWSLFENMAFPDSIVRVELKEIGKRIVKKCKGVPLAVKVLGSMMRTRQDESYWLRIEDSNLLDTNIQGENEISRILKFSYNNLPFKSRFCFVYCSIFPKDSIMRKMVLFQQWAGNGFISPDETNEIFMDLLSRCFFQDVENDDLGNITTFKMHDVIHDLAQSIAKCQCGMLDYSNEVGFLSNKRNIRYLSIDMVKEDSYSGFPIQLKDAQKLRTLQFFSPQIVNNHFLVVCFSILKFLRVLICNGARDIKEVPSSIDNLKLLRYVDFSDTDIKQLPETVCNLQNLQTLKLNFCYHLKVLPKNLWKLSKLSHLENEGVNLLSMPVGMNKLSLLETLSTFKVNDDGKNLNELRELRHLSGSLALEKLDNSEDVFYEKGILREKKYLVSLVLKWENDDSDGQVLEALEPHSNLKSLKISQFGGSMFPTWMSDPSQQLVDVALTYCPRSTRIPTFEQLPYLKDLLLNGLPLVEDVVEINDGIETNAVFLSLEKLRLHKMIKFRGWPEASTEFPKLNTLEISFCPELRDIPHIPTLRYLLLSYCDNALLLKLVGTHDLPLLSNLKFEFISNLACMIDDNYFKNLMALRELEIESCNDLVSFSDTAMMYLSSLQQLTISYCENLESLPNIKHLSSLQQLTISYCKNLKSLPNSMGSLKSLKVLDIERCPKLNLVLIDDPECLTSLESILIRNCGGFKSWSEGAIRKIFSFKKSFVHFCSKEEESLSELLQKIDPATNRLQRLGITGRHSYYPQSKYFRTCSLFICCFEKEQLPTESNKLKFPRLENLEIEDCPNLVSLPVGLRERMGDALTIRNCPRLES